MVWDACGMPPGALGTFSDPNFGSEKVRKSVHVTALAYFCSMCACVGSQVVSVRSESLNVHAMPVSLFFSIWARDPTSNQHPLQQLLQHNLNVVMQFGDVWYLFLDNFDGWSREEQFSYFFGKTADDGNTINFLDVRASVGEILWTEVVEPIKNATVKHPTTKIDQHRGRSSKISDALRWHILEQYCRSQKFHLVTYLDMDAVVLPHFHIRYAEFCQEAPAFCSTTAFLISTYRRSGPSAFQKREAPPLLQ